jgi:hypothetical protein
MLCRFITSSSARNRSSGTARPNTGSCSCRFTPWNRIRRPLTRSTPSTISTVRNPIRSATRSPGNSTTASYNRGTSADHGSTPGIVTVSPQGTTTSSDGIRTTAPGADSTINTPAPSR